MGGRDNFKVTQPVVGLDTVLVVYLHAIWDWLNKGLPKQPVSHTEQDFSIAPKRARDVAFHNFRNDRGSPAGLENAAKSAKFVDFMAALIPNHWLPNMAHSIMVKAPGIFNNNFFRSN